MDARKTLQLLVLLAVSYTARSESRVEIHKCCPPPQQLSSQLDSCVPYAAAANHSGVERVPWWIHVNTTIYDDVTGVGSATRPFLADHTSQLIHYGRELKCSRARMKYFAWNSFSRYKLLANGTLLLRTEDSTVPNLQIPPENYCSDRVVDSDVTHVFLVCPCERTVCINKCCPRGFELNINLFRKSVTYSCEEVASNWNGTNAMVQRVQHILLDSAIPQCDKDEDEVLLNTELKEKLNSLKILPNGSAVLEGYGHGRAFSSGDWCGDESVINNSTRVQNAIACHKKVTGTLEAGTVYGSLFLIGSLFLVLTLVVYALLPEMRRTAHAKALLCHVTALLVGSVTLASGQLRTVGSKEGCYVMGFVIQYTMLATFFWLNVVCIEVARTFKELLPPNFNNATERRKFFLYSLYAWGCPSIICIVSVILEFAENLPENIIRPDIGLRSCFLGTLKAQIAYFYGPMSVLLLANLVLYVYTTVQLVRAHQDTALATEAAGRTELQDRKERMILHLKLFLLMGLTWVLECASLNQKLSYWYVTDAVNMLRGVFIFVIFCCKRDMLQRLRKRTSGWCSSGCMGVVGSSKKGTHSRRGTDFTSVTRDHRGESSESLTTSSSDAARREAVVVLKQNY